MKRILVLGHKGMLGNAVVKYFSTLPHYEVMTVESRWGDQKFKEKLRNADADFIINCIGAIPQRKPTAEEYVNINVNLPAFLETLGKKIVHPTTDCEFLGNIEADKVYTKADVRDASDDYGKSKATIGGRIEKEFKNTKMLRVSIIGHELNTHVSLLDWFLSSQGEVKGYTNHYWNGITTLQWAKLCEEMIANWGDYQVLNQYGTEKNASKYEVLMTIKEVYGKDIIVTPFETPSTVNKCLATDKVILNLREQLMELKKFYNK